MHASVLNRRDAFKLGAAGLLAAAGARPAEAGAAATPAGPAPRFKLGLVTYNLAGEWDVPTIIARCKATGFEGVELRTTHKHGVEPDMDAARRRDVRRQFEDAGVRLWGLGSVCEFHSPDAATVEKNIETCRRFCELARDVGAAGVKVRPNGLPAEVPVPKTLEQIGKALRTCGEAADANGVEIWVEVHGRGTSDPPNMKTILEHCGHPKVGICWNSNPGDVKDGSVKASFEMLRPWLRSCHINELSSEYPWRELFGLLRQAAYDRYTLCEIQAFKTREPADVERLMKWYRALWVEQCRG